MYTDPLFSTPEVEIVNDGGELNRIGKLEVLSGDDAALANLRVCFANDGGRYNCGRCEKCIRNMVVLRILGVLDRCPAFASPLDLEALADSDEVIDEGRGLETWDVVLAMAEEAGHDPELIDALRRVSRRMAHAEMIEAMGKDKGGIVTSDRWKEVLPKFRAALLDSLREEDPDWFWSKVLNWLPTIRERAVGRLWKNDRRWLLSELKRLRRRSRSPWRRKDDP